MSTTETKREISNFFNTEYKEWAHSVIEERALPSVIDGFKPAARKVIHAANAGSLKDGKLYKLLALSGDSMKLSLYAHGDMSLNQVIINLCKSFNDNFNPLASDSQVGTLRDPDSAGSPRYLYVQHSKWMDLIYKKDYDLLDFVFDEGQYIEPTYYLPIIPVVLCRNNIGVAVGYAMHNISYNPVDVIDACKEYIKTRDIQKTNVRPYIRNIREDLWYQAPVAVKTKRGDTSSAPKMCWYNKGEWKYNVSRDKMVVTDLPYDVTYESFEKLLNKLIESGYIKSWTNMSSGEGINYEIKFIKGDLAKKVKADKTGDQIPQKFKLIKQVPDDLFWLLNEEGKLNYFNSLYSVIKYFVKFRLEIYEQRKSKTTKHLEEKLSQNEELIRFITLVCDNKLIINNRPKSEIKMDMDKYGLPVSLLGTSITKLTKEEIESLKEQNEALNKELYYIKNTTIEDMYLKDLSDLRRAIVKEFS